MKLFKKSLPKTSMDRIHSLASVINFILRIARLLIMLSIVASIVLVIIGFLTKQENQTIPVLFDTFIIGSMDHFGVFKGMEPIYKTAVSAAIVILVLVILYYFTGIFQDTLDEIRKNNHPFTVSTAKKLRKASWMILSALLYNPFFGIVMFLVTQLFSYLFEYGAELQVKADETSKIQEDIIMNFAEISENKSGQTGQHIRRVAEYTSILAEALGYPKEQCQNLRLASTMHDIGKLLIPSEILDKPGRLTDEEFTVIRKHPVYGEQLLHNVHGDVMEISRSVAQDHHERIDGKGYPNGKSGDEISMEGRIVAVADVYDALTSKRSYKDAWKPEDAYNEILKGKGTQFDAAVVDAFTASYDKINAVREKYADA